MLEDLQPRLFSPPTLWGGGTCKPISLITGQSLERGGLTSLGGSLLKIPSQESTKEHAHKNKPRNTLKRINQKNTLRQSGEWVGNSRSRWEKKRSLENFSRWVLPHCTPASPKSSIHSSISISIIVSWSILYIEIHSHNYLHPYIYMCTISTSSTRSTTSTIHSHIHN